MRLDVCKIGDFSDFAGVNLLGQNRRERVFKYAKTSDRLRCLCGGLLMRFVLGDEVENVAFNAYGKPFLPNGRVHFSLSHAGKYAVIASDASEVGVDIEPLRAVPSGVAEVAFLAREMAWLGENGGCEAFFKLWTAKESVVKAVGTGLNTPLNSFEIVCDEFGKNSSESWCFFGGKRWRLQWCEVDGHVICVASKTDKTIKISTLNRHILLKQHH